MMYLHINNVPFSVAESMKILLSDFTLSLLRSLKLWGVLPPEKKFRKLIGAVRWVLSNTGCNRETKL